MSKLKELCAEILVDGVIDGEETAKLESVILEDGKIDREEADALFALKDAAKEVCPEFEAFFVKAILAHVTEDGVVDAEEKEWLKAKIESDGQVDAMEAKLIEALAI